MLGQRSFKMENILIHETDRGSVVVGAIYIEAELENLLRAKFELESNTTAGEIRELLTGYMAPLGTLAAKTKLAYALGLINSEVRDIIDGIRAIRNAMAHKKVHRISTPAVNKMFAKLPWRIKRYSTAAMSDALSGIKRAKPREPAFSKELYSASGFRKSRMRLAFVVSMTCAMLQGATQKLVKRRPKAQN